MPGKLAIRIFKNFGNSSTFLLSACEEGLRCSPDDSQPLCAVRSVIQCVAVCNVVDGHIARNQCAAPLGQGNADRHFHLDRHLHLCGTKSYPGLRVSCWRKPGSPLPAALAAVALWLCKYSAGTQKETWVYAAEVASNRALLAWLISVSAWPHPVILLLPETVLLLSQDLSLLQFQTPKTSRPPPVSLSPSVGNATLWYWVDHRVC